MFIALKFIAAFLDPIAVVIVGSLIGCILLRRQWKRTGTVILGLAIGTLYLLSTEPIAFVLTSGLERSYAVSRLTNELSRVDAIVVLGGGANAAQGYQEIPELGGASWRRLWRAIEVRQTLGRDVPIIYAGGSGDPFDPVSPEADLARSYAVALGVPSERFWSESQSRNTYENGIAVVRVLRERLPNVEHAVIALVTSARHLPRAVGAFRRLGVAVVPIPADFDGGTSAIDPLSFVPSTNAFATSTASLHEWLGMMGYRVLGRM